MLSTTRGWSNTAMLQRYVHIKDEQKRKAVQGFEGMVRYTSTTLFAHNICGNDAYFGESQSYIYYVKLSNQSNP